jgi:hypothetical protein
MAPVFYTLIGILIVLNIRGYERQRQVITTGNGWFAVQYEHSQALVAQFTAASPDREKLRLETSDLFLDDQAHFLENVERSYLYLTGSIRTEPPIE